MVKQFQEQLIQHLFATIGTTYGAGNGSSTFNVPDLQDNVPVGKSRNKALASTGGANTVANSGNVGGQQLMQLYPQRTMLLTHTFRKTPLVKVTLLLVLF